jgi:hypothetical protein
VAFRSITFHHCDRKTFGVGNTITKIHHPVFA